MLVEEDVRTARWVRVLSALGADVYTEADVLFLMSMIWSVVGVYHFQGIECSPFSKCSNCTNKHI